LCAKLLETSAKTRFIIPVMQPLLSVSQTGRLARLFNSNAIEQTV